LAGASLSLKKGLKMKLPVTLILIYSPIPFTPAFWLPATTVDDDMAAGQPRRSDEQQAVIDKFLAILDNIGNVIDAVNEAVKELAEGILNVTGGEMMKDEEGEEMEMTTENPVDRADEVRLSEEQQALVDRLLAFLDKLPFVTDDVTDAVEGLAESLADGVQDTGLQSLLDHISSVKNDVTDAVEGLVESIQQFASNKADSLQDLHAKNVETIDNFAKDSVEAMNDFVEENVDSLQTFAKDALPEIKLPQIFVIDSDWLREDTSSETPEKDMPMTEMPNVDMAMTEKPTEM